LGKQDGFGFIRQAMKRNGIAYGFPVNDIIHLTVQPEFMFFRPLKMCWWLGKPLPGDLHQFQFTPGYTVFQLFLQFVP
jgi:hypothetical protein